jgi:hypothetical protein
VDLIDRIPRALSALAFMRFADASGTNIELKTRSERMNRTAISVPPHPAGFNAFSSRRCVTLFAISANMLRWRNVDEVRPSRDPGIDEGKQ